MRKLGLSAIFSFKWAISLCFLNFICLVPEACFEQFSGLHCYHGDVKIKYVRVAFSDHQARVITIELPNPLTCLLCPQPKHSNRIKAEILQDEIFQEQLSEAMQVRENVRLLKIL